MDKNIVGDKDEIFPPLYHWLHVRYWQPHNKEKDNYEHKIIRSGQKFLT